MAGETIDFSGDPRSAALAREDFVAHEDRLDSGHFFNILIMNPGIELAPGTGARSIHLHVTERQPLSNLYFMRDQQVVTDRGLLLSRMAKPQRAREPAITGFFWEVTGERVLGAVEAPGTLEGGDFIPFGNFALVGIGDRTNREGAAQLMASGIDFDEVGLVLQPEHPLLPGGRGDPMLHIHLDTFCNVAGEGLVIGERALLERAPVETYHREGRGDYRPSGNATSLAAYFGEKGFEIIDITTLEQMAYASNILCIRDRTILSVESDRIIPDVLANLQQKAARDPGRYGKLLAKAEEDYRKLRNEGQFFPHKKEIYQQGVDACPISLVNLTGGYGGAHCMTCALQRG